MTDAQNVSAGLRSAAAVVAAERYGMPVIDGDRAVLIAALHTVINWLIDNPGILCPQTINLVFHPKPGITPGSKELLQLADQLDGRVMASNGSQWVDKQIPLGEGAGGVNAKYTAFGRDRHYVD